MSRGLPGLALALALAAASPRLAAGTPAPGYDGKWSQLQPDGHLLTGSALDLVHRKLYLYGGSNWTVTDDFYEYDLTGNGGGPAWRRLPSGGAGTPDRLSGHAMAWDSRRGRFLLYGGRGPDEFHADLWAYDPASAAWTHIATAPGGPGPRRFHAAAYDSVGDALLIFGGETSGDYRRQSDLWALSFAVDPPAWARLPAAGEVPAGQDLAGLFVEAAPHRVLLVGGMSQDERDEARVFARPLDGDSTWTRLTGAGLGPRDRKSYPAAYDPVRHRLLVLPRPLEEMDRADAWSFDLEGGAGWSEILPSGPALTPHDYAFAQYEPAADRLYLVGGIVPTPEGGGIFEADLWSLRASGGESWISLLGPDALAPAPRADIAWGHDVAGERMYFFGGTSATDAGYGVYGDVWSLDLAGPPHWREEAATAEGPGARWGACGAFDSRRRRLVVFGGVALGVRVAETLAFDVAARTWSRIDATGTPPSGRLAATAFYDSLADRVLVFGGDDGSPRNDLWALELGGTPHWRELFPLGPALPAGRVYHSMTYDSRRDALWIYGGYGEDGGQTAVLGDAWRLDLAGDGLWSPAQLSGKAPPARAQHGAAFDPVRDRMVVLWGEGAGGARRTEILALQPANGPSWRPLGVQGIHPYPGLQPLCVWDAPRDRLVMYGGGYGSRFFTTVGDLWAAEWAAPETAPGVAPVAQHAHIRPNPSFGQAAIEFTLTSGATVQASIYDMAGRLVRRLEGGPRAAGPVSLGWDGRDGHGVRAPAGVYAVRLDVAGTLTNQKIVLLR